MISRLGNYTWSTEQHPYIEPSALAPRRGALDLRGRRSAGEERAGTSASGWGTASRSTSSSSRRQARSRRPASRRLDGARRQARLLRPAQLRLQSGPLLEEPERAAGSARSTRRRCSTRSSARARRGPVPGQTDEQARIEAERRAATEKSVIDGVLADANSLMNRVGSDDRKIVQQYLDSLREIEKNATRVQSTMNPSMGLGCSPIGQPGVVPEPPGQAEGLNENDNTGAGPYKHEDHAKVTIDLIVMADSMRRDARDHPHARRHALRVRVPVHPGGRPRQGGTRVQERGQPALPLLPARRRQPGPRDRERPVRDRRSRATSITRRSTAGSTRRARSSRSGSTRSPRATARCSITP